MSPRFRSAADYGETNYKLKNKLYSIAYNSAGPYQKCIESVTSDITAHEFDSTWEMTDVVTPNFRKRIKSGEVINSPMTSETSFQENTPTSVVSNRTREVVLQEGTFLQGSYLEGTYPSSVVLGANFPCSHLSTYDIDVESLEDVANTQAHANVDMSEAQALMIAAEGRKTVESLMDISTRAVRLFRIYNKITRLKGLSRREKKYLKENLTPKAIADRYMEVRYSLRPLLYDAASIVKALQPAKHYDRFTFRGYASDTQTAGATGTERALSSTNTRIRPRTVTTRTVEVRAGVLTAIDFDSQLNVWGFDQPIETLWEVIPLSFVADWFFNIGQTIAAHTPEVGTRELASWTVTKDTSVTTVEPDTIRPYYSGSTVEISNCKVSSTSKSVVRKVNPPLALVPRLTVRLNALKLLDLGIILKNLAPSGGGFDKLTRKMY